MTVPAKAGGGNNTVNLRREGQVRRLIKANLVNCDQTLKWLSSLAHFNVGVILVVVGF